MEEKKLTKTEKHIRYNNMINRCYNEVWQEEWGQRYKDTTVCEEWLNDKYNTFFTWVDNNYYTVGDEQMDLDHNIMQYVSNVYSPDTCIFAPHKINTLYESLEVGDTNITYNSRKNTFSVKVYDEGEFIIQHGFLTYNEALDCYCAIKEAIIADKADELKGKIPERLYNRMINTDVKLINAPHYYTA